MNKIVIIFVCLLSAFLVGCKSDTTSPNSLGTIYGKVTDSDVGIGNILVKTIPSTQSVRTDLDGYYSISNVPVGEYKVVAFRSYYDSAYTVVSVKDNLKVNADIEINQYGSISGQIKDNKSQKVLDGAIVMTSPNIGSARTDADGKFLLNNVPAGNYTITITRSGYSDLSKSLIVTSKKTTAVNWSLDPIYGFIRGIAMDSIGVLSGVNITTTPSSEAVTTDSKGYYLIKNVLVGEYTITAQKIKYSTATIKVKTIAYDTVTANILMKK